MASMFARLFARGQAESVGESESESESESEWESDEQDEEEEEAAEEEEVQAAVGVAKARQSASSSSSSTSNTPTDESGLVSASGSSSSVGVGANRWTGGENPLLPEELCELPTFLHSACCEPPLVADTRRRLKKKYLKRPESFVAEDYERMLADDWTVSRFLLRCRLQPRRAARLMEQCGKFRREFRMGQSKLADFPIEFHRAGGLFRYAPDRVGNQTLFMRVKMHRRLPELSQIMKEFILCCLEQCDRANNGRGTAVIFDLTGCGLQNVDLGFLFWLVYSFRNYCPKGLSYIIIYNLPWMLNATAKLALSWLSSTNKRRLRFVSGDTIQDFIAPENLPDYMGGTCSIDYRRVPEGSRPAEETAEAYKLTRAQSRKIRDIYAKFLKDVDSEITIETEEVQSKAAN